MPRAAADVWNRLDVGLSSFPTLSLEIVGQVYEAMLERATAKSPREEAVAITL